MDTADSVHKHGVADDDTRHAVAQSIRVVRQGSADRVLVIGPNRVSALLEVVVLDPDTELVIIHAMGLRPKFYRFLKGGEQMPRTREQLEQAAAEAMQWLDGLDPDNPDVPVEETADLRAVGLALAAIAASETNLAATVAAARANGRSWARIAAVLGVSKQAAMRRFGSPGLQRS
ncbi:MAG TPA: hypothetical protein VGH89_07985 [Pseudonocardia sp.]|jgi:hypothetical protein